jgi:serine beta-lactamase-like protein LACTB, mitochondrial
MFSRTPLAFFLLTLLIVGAACPPAPASSPAFSCAEARAVDRAVRAEMDRQQAVGVAIGVIRGGRVVYLRGYGCEDREAGVPVTSKTLFRWASISKTLTAVAAMQLAERGQLDLDADVRTYVPEFPDKGVRITTRQLLCHQSGIVHYDNGKILRARRDYDVAHPFESVITALDCFKQSPLVAKPGKKFSYSTHGYMLLAAVVERAGREKFADQIHRRIIAPLGLCTLQPDYQWIEIPHRAIGYRKRGKSREIVRSIDADVSWKLGGGGYLSNVDDLTRWGVALIHGALVSKSTEKTMWTRQKTSAGRPTPVGLGFFLRRSDGVLEVSHGGAQEKTRTQLTLYPREGRGVVVMCNSEYADPKRFVAAIEKALAERPTPATCEPCIRVRRGILRRCGCRD